MAKTTEITKKSTKPKAKQPIKRTPQKQIKGVRRLIFETRGELKKVTWPTRKEAFNLTKIVLVVLLVMSAFLGTMDTLFFEFFKFILAA